MLGHLHKNLEARIYMFKTSTPTQPHYILTKFSFPNIIPQQFIELEVWLIKVKATFHSFKLKPALWIRGYERNLKITTFNLRFEFPWLYQPKPKPNTHRQLHIDPIHLYHPPSDPLSLHPRAPPSSVPGPLSLQPPSCFYVLDRTAKRLHNGTAVLRNIHWPGSHRSRRLRAVG